MSTPTIPAGNLYFNATLWAGNGTLPRTIINGPAGASFQPDFVWMKDRTVAYYHQTYDSVRGTSTGGGVLYPNTTDAVDNTYLLSSFNSNGVTLGTNLSAVNASGSNIVGWMWKANGAAVTNNDGNRTSQVSANTTSGFSVVTYTFVTSGTNTVGHGLGVAPAMIIMKDRTTGYNWDVYHQSVGYTQRLILNSTSAATSGFWASAPTSTTFAVTSSMGSNNDEIVAYCWTPIAGYSQFGSYVGTSYSTGADGPFIYCGFRPKFVMIKISSSTGDWVMMDSSQNTYNVAQNYLLADQAYAENAGGAVADMDFLSNGFKIRNSGSSSQSTNIGTQTYIYAAFAENPFKYANAR